MRPLLLLSNDDGVNAPGLRHLVEVLRPVADLFVMAPEGPRSAMSCAITCDKPLRWQILSDTPGLTVCSCSGTPVDCVKIALDTAMPRKPNLVVGGINHGDNSAVNAHYSGTIGVVTEAVLQGFPAVAFSLCDHRMDADFTPLDSWLVPLVEKALQCNMPPMTCLNVNFPLAQIFKGIRVCRMAHTRWVDEFEKREHPMGGDYYWMVGESLYTTPEREDTDRWALDHGYVAVTPLSFDLSCPELMASFEALLHNDNTQTTTI